MLKQRRRLIICRLPTTRSAIEPRGSTQAWECGSCRGPSRRAGIRCHGWPGRRSAGTHLTALLAEISLHRPDHSLAIGWDAAPAHVARPRIDDMYGGVDVLRVSGAKGDRVASLDVLLTLSPLRPIPAAGGRCRNRETQ